GCRGEREPARAATEDDIPLGERKTVTDFCYLLDKSKQLFNGLRDLPQYGHKQWQSYFGRTFDVYTKLWKFQQQHRQVLDTRYGLKRWQIGEVASKIGQLYYHYYLRTSETSYLNEAFSFYSAIRQRSYYYQVNKEDRAELVVKKLRYYARYIVVCLLLNKMDLVKVLVKELSEEIEDYTQRFNTEDQLEWNLVLQEVAAFIEADPAVVLNDHNSMLVTSNRLQDGSVPPLEQGMVVGQLVLADALIVGNCNNQVKFSELTVDMFRMLQALEREPVNLATQTSKQATLVGFWLNAFTDKQPGRAPWVKARPPDARHRAPPPGLAPEWGPGDLRPGEGTPSPMFLSIIGVFK
uniref:Uncharacterized protein n=1 Tax=Xiphophorus couchianus TaxID=32473 RepID=A0A3B5L0Y0_9TELE